MSHTEKLAPDLIATEASNPAFALSTFTAAYERRLPAMMALKESDLAPLNVDPRAAITTVLGALAAIEQLREGVSGLNNVDQSLIDGLEDYARAAGEAHSRYVTVLTSEDDLEALSKEARELRATLRSDVAVLVQRGLIDPARHAAFKGRTGYKNLAFELINYANLLRDWWPRIEGRTGVRVEEIQRAKQLGERLALAAGRREHARGPVKEVTRIRQRAMTLLFRAYNETRRAIGFLRWRERDVNTIAPSLFAGRGGRGKVRTVTRSRALPFAGHSS